MLNILLRRSARSWPKLIYRGAVIVFWIAAILIMLEFAQRLYVSGMRIPSHFYKCARMDKAMASDEAEVLSYMKNAVSPPLGIKRELPDRDSFFTLDNVGRQKFAQERRELDMLCAPDGVIKAKYVSTEPAQIVEIASRVGVEQSVSILLPEQERRDFDEVLRGGLSNHSTNMREYNIPIEKGWYACSMCFRPLFNASEEVESVLISLCDSKYEVISKKYRPYVYRNSRFDPLFPQFITSEFWTNGQGFRDEEVVLPKPTGVYRIVCIGGSTTVEGPHNDLTYPNLLEKKLRDYFKSSAIEVINCGVDAIGTIGELERLSDYLALQPDLVITYHFTNDSIMAHQLADDEYRSRHPTLSSLKEWLERFVFLSEHFHSWFLPGKEELRTAILSDIIARERQMLERIRATGADMAMCSLAYPDLPRLSGKERRYYQPRYTAVSWGQNQELYLYARMADVYNELIQTFCAQEGLLYLPVGENLRGGTEYFSDIAHLHLPGIRRKADMIFEHLKDYLSTRLHPANP